MLAFHDQGSEVDGKSTERMNFRAKPRIKEAIQRAAALSGVDDSGLRMNAAYKSAIETITAHDCTMLRPIDHAAFFVALDKPPTPTDKLRAASAVKRGQLIGVERNRECPIRHRVGRSRQAQSIGFFVWYRVS